MLKGKHFYGAIFEKEEDNRYSIFFPSIPEAITMGKNFRDGVLMAKEVLELSLEDKVEAPLESIDKYIVEENQMIVMIEADLDNFRKKYKSQLVKKTLTIPKWLDIAGKEQGINFSKCLREALEKELIEK